MLPDGNMDIFTLDDVSRYLDFMGNYSTSEAFSVIGCSDELGDMKANILFYGDEYHSATYSLTACALVISNLTDNVSMFTGLEDADNDGTNNVNDLDNAGDFMPFLVKTHESATNAFFRLEFDEKKIKIWTEDSSAMITRTNSYIPNGNRLQAYHNYSYNDLFADGAEQTYYVQGLEAGEHNIDIVYVLDGEDLWAEEVIAIFVSVKFSEEFVNTRNLYHPDDDYPQYTNCIAIEWQASPNNKINLYNLLEIIPDNDYSEEITFEIEDSIYGSASIDTNDYLNYSTSDLDEGDIYSFAASNVFTFFAELIVFWVICC